MVPAVSSDRKGGLGDPGRRGSSSISKVVDLVNLVWTERSGPVPRPSCLQPLRGPHWPTMMIVSPRPQTWGLDVDNPVTSPGRSRRSSQLPRRSPFREPPAKRRGAEEDDRLSPSGTSVSLFERRSLPAPPAARPRALLWTIFADVDQGHRGCRARARPSATRSTPARSNHRGAARMTFSIPVEVFRALDKGTR